MIGMFRGEYFFLSNFYNAPLIFHAIKYCNSEAAFQAMKCKTREERVAFSSLTPSEAKLKGKQVRLRDDWEDVKVEIMEAVCRAKFNQHPELKTRLIATGEEPLQEGNIWGDKEWGVCNGHGKNYLGLILMKLRNEFREEG